MVARASDAAVVQRGNHDAWGVPVQADHFQDPNAWPVPIGFAGGLYDADTGLVHFGAREYDPEVGRWISKDPIVFAGGDANLYGYVNGDPVNSVDRSGLVVSTITNPLGHVAETLQALHNVLNPWWWFGVWFGHQDPEKNAIDYGEEYCEEMAAKCNLKKAIKSGKARKCEGPYRQTPAPPDDECHKCMMPARSAASAAAAMTSRLASASRRS